MILQEPQVTEADKQTPQTAKSTSKKTRARKTKADVDFDYENNGPNKGKKTIKTECVSKVHTL